MLTTTTAARRAGLTRRAVLKAIRLGQLRADRFGQAWAISDEALADWLATRRGPGRPPAMPPNPPANPPEEVRAAVERAMRSGRGLVGEGEPDDLPHGHCPLPAVDL